MGLFTSKSDLFKWQQLVAPNTPKLVMNKQQLQAETKRQAAAKIKIIQDCVRLVNTTIKPDVFFKRHDMLKEKAYELTLFEPYLQFTGKSPSEAYREILEKEPDTIFDFLERYFEAVEIKVDKLKTNKAKQNQYLAFYASLQPYFLYMDEETVDSIEVAYKEGFNKYL